MPPILREPLEDATAWKAAEIVERGNWLHVLSTDELAAIQTALEQVKRSKRRATEFGPEDFPLGVLEPAIARWMEALYRGAGFINVKGLPIERYSHEELEIIHWGIGTHMGTAVSRNAAGDLLSHIRDVGANPLDRSKRLYKTNVELGFHSDGSDIASLLCIRQAKFGGRSRLASCGAIYNEILGRRPDLIPLLYEPFYWDRNEEQGEGEEPFFKLPICSVHGGRFRLFFIGWYIRNAQRHLAVPRLSAEQHQLLDLIEEIALDPEFHLEFRLEPGELAFLKNSAALHMRTAYEDHEEPERKRHLIRMWLTAHGHWADGDAFVQQGIPVKQGVVSDADDIHASAARSGGPR